MVAKVCQPRMGGALALGHVQLGPGEKTYALQ